MLVLLGAEEQAALPQRLDDVRVGVEHGAPREGDDALVEGAVLLHRVLHGHAVALAELEVVLAEGERGMHDPRAVVGGHEVGLENGVRKRTEIVDVGEGRLVARAGQLRALDLGLDLHALAEHAFDERLGHDQGLVAHLRPHVGDVGRHRQRSVREQGPGRGGPAEE